MPTKWWWPSLRSAAGTQTAAAPPIMPCTRLSTSLADGRFCGLTWFGLGLGVGVGVGLGVGLGLGFCGLTVSIEP